MDEANVGVAGEKTSNTGFVTLSIVSISKSYNSALGLIPASSTISIKKPCKSEIVLWNTIKCGFVQLKCMFVFRKTYQLLYKFLCSCLL